MGGPIDQSKPLDVPDDRFLTWLVDETGRHLRILKEMQDGCDKLINIISSPSGITFHDANRPFFRSKHTTEMERCGK